MKEDNKINYESVNFCTMPEEKLLMLIDYLGCTEVIKNSECVQKIKGDECIEKKWSWYDEVIVKPKEIFYAPDPYPGSVIFTVEKYAKLMLLFNKYVHTPVKKYKLWKILMQNKQSKL
jgi:hypothetical protein